MEIRLVKDNVTSSVMLDETEMRKIPYVAFKTLCEKAESLLADGETLKRLVYVDDEGDSCTLTAVSVVDALDFAEVDGTARILCFKVETSGQPKSAPEVSQWSPVKAIVTHSSMKAVASQREMQDGVAAWLDRPDYTYQNVPEEMQGGTLYSFLHKPAGGGSFTIEAAEGAIVYIFSEAHRDGGFPNLGWERIESGRFLWQEGAKNNFKKWGLSAWKKTHNGSLLIVPTVECLVGGVVITTGARSKEPRREETIDPNVLLKVFSNMTLGLDIRKVVPKLAQAALAVITDTQFDQFDQLSSLLDLFLGLAEGAVDANDIVAHIAAVVDVVRALPGPTQRDLAERSLSELAAVVEELRHDAWSCTGSVVDTDAVRCKVQEQEFQVGSSLFYRKPSDSKSEQVILVKVHYDDDPPYYTIRMPDGREKQTERANLTTSSDEALASEASPRAREEEKPEEEERTGLINESAGWDFKSAKVLHSTITLNPEEAHFFPEAVGDVTAEHTSLLANYKHLQQAFRLGQVHVNHALPATAVIARVVISNDGEVAWPETTSIHIAAGPDYGFPHFQLPSLAPGECAELVLDLDIGQGLIGESALSAWALVDENGQPFGALMLLEVVHV